MSTGLGRVGLWRREAEKKRRVEREWRSEREVRVMGFDLVVSVCRCPPAVVKVVGWLWGYRNYGSRTIMGKVTGDPGVR